MSEPNSLEFALGVKRHIRKWLFKFDNIRAVTVGVYRDDLCCIDSPEDQIVNVFYAKGKPIDFMVKAAVVNECKPLKVVFIEDDY